MKLAPILSRLGFSGRNQNAVDQGQASEADIIACFRLLLGREPQSNEWPGHSAHAGRPLEDVVRIYVNSQEFHERGLLTRKSIVPEVADLHGFQLYADRNDPEVGAAVLAGEYEPQVTHVFRALLRPGDHVIDVGANIGFFTMQSAALVGETGSVLAIEPNAQNVKLLEASRRLNHFHNVTVLQAAASDGLGLLVLHAGSSNGSTASTPDDLSELLAATTVASLPIDRLVDDSKRIALIKIDIEGAEGLAIKGAKRIIERDHPFVISEFCPDAIHQISKITAADYLTFFVDRNYHIAELEPHGIRLHGQDVQSAIKAHESSGVSHLDLLLFHGDVPPESLTIISRPASV